MDLSNIVSISGMSDLYKVAGQMKNGLILEGITDGKRIPVYASDKVSALDDISIFSEEDDIPLVEVLDKIAENEGGKPSKITHKSSKEELTGVLEAALPNYDKDRVYMSDIKKLVKWYNILAEAGLAEVKKEEKKVAKKEESDEEKAEESNNESPKSEKAAVESPE